MQAALPEMKPGGVILNNCSIEAYEPKGQFAVYVSTKAAPVSLTKIFPKNACSRNSCKWRGAKPCVDAAGPGDYAERAGAEFWHIELVPSGREPGK
jgi:NAD(P)-dependent dehydrogenase (short-subunit alcohol dehydrogenase family)